MPKKNGKTKSLPKAKKKNKKDKSTNKKEEKNTKTEKNDVIKNNKIHSEDIDDLNEYYNIIIEEEYPDDEEIEIKEYSEEKKEGIDKKKNENINIENDNKIDEIFSSNLTKEKDKVDSNKEIISDTIDKERKKRT